MHFKLYGFGFIMSIYCICNSPEDSWWMYRVVNVVCIFLQVIIHVSIMHKHRSLQLSHDVTYICHKRFTENIVYFITIHYWESKRVTGNRQWRITCQACMLLKKQCHQTICIWHKYIFTCIILQVNRRLFFQSHHWNTGKTSPFQSVCIFSQVIELSIIWLQ